jgi:hypothetical protein
MQHYTETGSRHTLIICILCVYMHICMLYVCIHMCDLPLPLSSLCVKVLYLCLGMPTLVLDLRLVWLYVE